VGKPEIIRLDKNRISSNLGIENGLTSWKNGESGICKQNQTLERKEWESGQTINSLHCNKHFEKL
jgi:hypothetical protein